jgi:hypothetical protein
MSSDPRFYWPKSAENISYSVLVGYSGVTDQLGLHGAGSEGFFVAQVRL